MGEVRLPEGLARELRALCAELDTPVYVVGGYVRGSLLGLPPADVDIASAALPEQVLAAAARMGVQAALVHRTLGTVELYLAGERVEHTAFRRESYAPGGGHAPQAVHLGATLLEDALRRDFSVNALYYDVAADKVLDPTGRGLADLGFQFLLDNPLGTGELLGPVPCKAYPAASSFNLRHSNTLSLPSFLIYIILHI